MYSGKPSGEPGPYYIRGSLSTVKALVSQMQEFVDLKDRIISLDRLYTSLELFEWFQTQGIAAIGTIDSVRKGILVCTTRDKDSHWKGREVIPSILEQR